MADSLGLGNRSKQGKSGVLVSQFTSWSIGKGRSGGIDIRLRTTKQYFGNQLTGFEPRNIVPSSWCRYRLAP